MKKDSKIFFLLINVLSMLLAYNAVAQTPSTIANTDNITKQTANSSDSLDSKTAQDIYKEGIKFFDNQQYKQAANKFRKAYNIKKTWKLLYNIGQSEAAAKRYGRSLDAFEQYLVDGGDDVPEDKKEMVLDEIQRMRILVGTLDVKADNGSKLYIDDDLRGTMPFKGIIRVAAGDHNIKIKLNKETLFDKDMRIAGGMTTSINALKKLQQNENIIVKKQEPKQQQTEVQKNKTITNPDITKSSANKMPVKLKAGIITGVIGLAFTGLGIGFAIKGSVDANTADKLDPSDPIDKKDLERYNDKYLPVNNAIMITGLAVGGAAIIAGTVLIILGVKDKNRQKVAVTPAFGGFTVAF